MRRDLMRPNPPRSKWESDMFFLFFVCVCAAFLVATMVQPMHRPRSYSPRTTTRLVLRLAKILPLSQGRLPSSSYQGTRKIVFPEWFDYVMPEQVVWIESGIRTSRPCIESRTRAVQVAAVQRRIEWSERYSIAEWQAIIASSKQRLVLMVRIQPSTRYEHLSFERIFVTWQLATTEGERRAFYSWIPEHEIRTELLNRAVSRQWLRLTLNDPDPPLTAVWQIRHCSVRRRF